jgi:hypothetical protein
VKDVGVARVKLDSLVVVLNGAAVPAFGAKGKAAIVVGDGAVRVELDGLVVVLDGAIVLVFFAIGEAAIDEGGRRWV